MKKSMEHQLVDYGQHLQNLVENMEVAVPSEIESPSASYEEVAAPPTPPRWREAELRRPLRTIAIAIAAAVITTLIIGAPLLLVGGGTDEAPFVTEPVPEPTVATTVPPPTTEATPTTMPAATPVIPSLGTGWDIVLSSRPGDALSLEPGPVFPTDAGYYVSFLDVESGELHPYLMTLDDAEPILIESMPAGSPGTSAYGFVTGGPGVVAWANVGPESATEAQLWVSSHGIDFERVAGDLLAGCGSASVCRGTEIYAAAASPEGRVVALAYDPLVWNAECECFVPNPVALVTDDGYEWTRQPLDLLSVLPAEWQGAADLRNPLVYVGGRWLTYGTHYVDACMCTHVAFFASANGIDWQHIDTGDLFEETYLMGIAANDRGVVAITGQAAYWSGDGYDWTRTTLTDQLMALGVAAYDDGYVVVSSSNVRDGAPLDAIWYSTAGTTWSRMPLQLEEPAWWNTIVGDGPNLVAAGGEGAETHLQGIWRWSG